MSVRHLSRHVSTHRQFPQIVYPVALQTDYVPLRHMLPELERLITAFTPPLPLHPILTRRPRIAYGSSNVHDTNDPASACGIDGLHEFPVFPLPTPTRTSFALFEPLLTLLTCRSSSLGPPLPRFPPLPRVRPGQSQGSLAQWYSVRGSLDLSS